MHPALRKGPLFYTKKNYFPLFLGKHTPHFISCLFNLLAQLSSLFGIVRNKGQSTAQVCSASLERERRRRSGCGTNYHSQYLNTAPYLLIHASAYDTNSTACDWNTLKCLVLSSVSFPAYSLWARQVGRYTKEGLILIYTFEKPIIHRL